MKKRWICLTAWIMILQMAVSPYAVQAAGIRAGAGESGYGTEEGVRAGNTKTAVRRAGKKKSGSTLKATSRKKKQGWVIRKGYVYFYTAEGKKLKNGIHEIGRKKYYFDKKGRQRTGWRKVHGHSYFFRYANGKNGYMVTGKKVDGIRLKKNGRAAPQGTRAKRKLPIVVEVQKLADKVGKPTMRKSKILWRCFEYVKSHYGGAIVPELGHSAGDWDLDYVSYMLKHGSGDCYCFGATFAYYANALGFKNVLTVNDDGHGWTEIDGKTYDVNWAKVIGSQKCYAVPASLSGKDGRPNWAAYRTYWRNCDH